VGRERQSEGHTDGGMERTKKTNTILPGLLYFFLSIEKEKSLLLGERRSLNKAPVLEVLGA